MKKLIVLSLGMLGMVLEGAAPAKTSSNQISTATNVSSTSSEVELTAAFTVPILPNNGETAFGFNFGILTPIDGVARLSVGGDLGLHFWGDAGTGLQLLPTAVYQLGQNAKWKPYAGLSAGPYLIFNNGSSVDFALFFRPGVTVAFNDSLSLNIEAKFGQLFNTFAFAPAAAIAFSL